MTRRLLRGITLLAALASLPAPALAGSHRVIDDNDTVPLKGNVHPLARPEFDVGPTDPKLPMERMVLSLKIAPAKQAELERFLAEQQDPDSADFHRWLVPEEFRARFAPPQEDIDAVTSWLVARGFSVDEVARGGTSINFSGTAGTVQRALHTRMRDFMVEGRLRHANDVDPAIPRGLADLVAGVVSLHNFPVKPMNTGARPVPQDALQPQYTVNGGTHYLSPADFATIYNVNALYAAGIDGTGQSIAVVGRTRPSSSNWTTFRSNMGLPANPVTVMPFTGSCTDPGDVGGGEDNEADLDVEWAGAVAKNATIKFFPCKTTTTDGVHLSAQYIVNNNTAPVMTTSFGLCEQFLGVGENAFYNSLWQQAAAQGITALVSTGDAGVAGCNNPNTETVGTVVAVNGIASTPYNVAVGGTQFNDASGGYWSASNSGSGYTSALGYIPETAWNESNTVSGGSGIWATGGGASSLYANPAWQVAPGVPANGKRNIPDVSLTAAAHDGYLVRTQGGLYAMSGTSASAPSFAGLMALVVQKTGQRQGNANTRLYQLGNAQYGSGGAAVFHDTTSGNNSVPGVTGYSSTTGYDLATGLGSVDANALVNNWVPPPAPLAIGSAAALPNGTTGVAYSSALAASGGTLPYAWSVTGGSLAPGLTLSSAGTVSGTPTATGVFSCTVQVADASGGSVVKTLSLAVSAAACANWPVLQGSGSTLFYPDFVSSYPLAADSDLIRLQALDFAGDFLFDRDIAVTLTGGYNCGYTANTGSTGLLGRIRLSSGKVNIDKVRLK